MHERLLSVHNSWRIIQIMANDVFKLSESAKQQPTCLPMKIARTARGYPPGYCLATAYRTMV